mmetsp:Transcript_24382/g.37789  ORF Transcript_24382/g.37789 Transcript_24382/m.37789 type:complete len:116 (-) Transcript_24382:1165-1512(-)
MAEIQHPEYFEFVQDFLLTFLPTLKVESLCIIQAAIGRIQKEVKGQMSSEHASHIVQKCLNILKALSGRKEFLIENYQAVETTFLPLFEYMAEPGSIDFVEDLLVLIKNFIRKTS